MYFSCEGSILSAHNVTVRWQPKLPSINQVILSMQKDQDLPEQTDLSSEEAAPVNEAPQNVETTAKKPQKQKKKGIAAAPREPSPATQEALQRIEQLPTPEEKIQSALEFMRASLTQSGNPRFKDFWDMRHHCLNLFKENLSAASRAHLWSSYVEISSEARRLKEILDEQSAFASEQIELAIAALEKDLNEYTQLVAQMKPAPIVASSSTIKGKRELYEKLQGELNLLNTLAARINGLRKEIIKTDMRMKTKAKFFDKLSVAGDKIFPRRKELVKQISQQFLQDIRHFVEGEFSGDIGKSGQPLYVLREEIKILQGIAKILTLNTQSFKETREMLSSCWDKIRESEKKKKEEFAQKRQASQQNSEIVLEKIKLLEANAQKEGATLAQVQVEAKEIQEFMRTLDLDRDSVHSLKAQIRQAIQPLVDREKSAEEARIEKHRQEEHGKKQKVLDVLHKTEQLLSDVHSIELIEIMETKERLEKEFSEAHAGKTEKLRFEKTLKRLAEAIVDKKEKALLNLSAQDRETLDQLKGILLERIQARDEIKKNLETNRKALGGSGFDFEKAMLYREMMDTDKARLAKINESISEIEHKIAEIEG